jgi:serine/threonine protein kinase/capsular polysaccharide biosynthesis protein
MKAGLNTGTEPGVEGSKGSGFVPPPVADIAKLFPQLEILEFIGKGGMGAVYKARQPNLDRLVALKILPPATAGDPGFAERFNREARALARLNHPNIVAVHDFGQAGALHYLVMEFVDGGNLRQIEQAGRLTPEQALAIVPQICEALQFAHNEGIVHRDIKPENILLDKKGRVKLTDFGIAKFFGLATEQAPLTGARDIVGTPHYMAPEQIEKPRTVDHRADIYSLGVVFYEMLTGELPLGKFAAPSRKVQMDVRLDEVVLQALEKEPELRYQQASQVKTAVETIVKSEGRSPKAEQPGPKPDTDAIERELLARDYVLDIGSCLRRGWALVRSDFWPLVAITALVLVLYGAAGSVGSVSRSSSSTEVSAWGLGLLMCGPLMGGLYLHFLKKIRGGRVRVETAFSGFSSSFLQLVLAGFVTDVLMLLGLFCCILPGIYLFVAWFFTLPLVIDKRLDFWPAMRVSRKTISKHWWKFLGFLIVLALVNLAGIMACFVGFFVAFPVSLAALMYAYEDIFNAPRLPSAPPVGSGAPGAENWVQSNIAVQPQGLQSRVTVMVAGLLVLLLLGVATLAFFTGTLTSFCVALAAVALTLAILLRVRRSALPGGFVATFLLVFLLVFGAADLITSIMPESFVSTARLKLTPSTAEAPQTSGTRAQSGAYDPHLLATECEVVRSEEILGSVVKALDLDREWSKRYANGEPLKTAQTINLLKGRVDVRPVGNTSLIAINVYGDQPEESARIANEIAGVYAKHFRMNIDPFRVEIIDRATPGLHPVRPNKPLNLAIGALLGLGLGAMAGAARVARRARKTRG